MLQYLCNTISYSCTCVGGYELQMLSLVIDHLTWGKDDHDNVI